MYTKYWQLLKKPFENVSDPGFFYASGEHREGLSRLMYAVREHKPGVLLLGGYGTGKTFLSRALRERCQSDNFKFVTISNPRLSAHELLEEINIGLGAVSPLGRPASKPELLRAFAAVVEDNFAKGSYSVIVVDEIQSIPEEGLFEELRLLLNVQRDDSILFTLILVGQPSFLDLLEKMPQLEHRIPVRYVLNPLNEEETSHYITHRLEMAGQARRIFTQESCKLIYSFSGGTPRVINNICDLALLAGFINKLEIIDADVITKVAQDLHDGLKKVNEASA